MAENTQKPIYDDKVKAILAELTGGKTREEIAREMGYKGVRSLDMYIRRRHFRWDKHRGTYVPAASRQQGAPELPASSKLAAVIRQHSQGAEPKQIAKNLGFAGHLEMAQYMKSKGYVYSDDHNTYVKKVGEITEENPTETETQIKTRTDRDTETGAEITNQSTANGGNNDRPPGISQEEREVLEILCRNRDQLIELLMPASDSGRIPRYALGGTFVTKSVHMSSRLDRMVRDFSAERALRQREIFEVALIEFFRRYGFEREVETMLGN